MELTARSAYLFISCLVILPHSLHFQPVTETWEQDLSTDMKIGVSLTGYQGVDLVCESDSFNVSVFLEDDFEGVFYTRGSFSADGKESACYTKRGVAGLYSLQIPFSECKTVEDKSEGKFVNTVVVQHDPDLIMPGDAAFTLSCSTDRAVATSVISVVDPDPAVKVVSNYTARDTTSRVSFRPQHFKDEL